MSEERKKLAIPDLAARKRAGERLVMVAVADTLTATWAWRAGVDIVGVGDAAASLVGPAIYEQYVWPIEKRLVDGIHELGATVRLHICGNTRAILDGMSDKDRKANV